MICNYLKLSQKWSDKEGPSNTCCDMRQEHMNQFPATWVTLMPVLMFALPGEGRLYMRLSPSSNKPSLLTPSLPPTVWTVDPTPTLPLPQGEIQWGKTADQSNNLILLLSVGMNMTWPHLIIFICIFICYWFNHIISILNPKIKGRKTFDVGIKRKKS